MIRRFVAVACSAAILILVVAVLVAREQTPAASAQQAVPIIVVETSRGTFAFETFPKEAPLSVAHIVALVKRSFYDGQRIHRALQDFVVQFGDPQTRDLDARHLWGRGPGASSGSAIGVAEISPRRKHGPLMVGLAHVGEPAQADSQLYITLAARPDLDGQYVVIGRVVEGPEVPSLLEVGDEIRRVYLRE